jgi:hypothetical protein
MTRYQVEQKINNNVLLTAQTKKIYGARAYQTLDSIKTLVSEISATQPDGIVLGNLTVLESADTIFIAALVGLQISNKNQRNIPKTIMNYFNTKLKAIDPAATITIFTEQKSMPQFTYLYLNERIDRVINELQQKYPKPQEYAPQPFMPLPDDDDDIQPERKQQASPEKKTEEKKEPIKKKRTFGDIGGKILGD